MNTFTVRPTPHAARPAALRELQRAGHRTQSTLAACTHRCAGGRPCTCSAGRAHHWHICADPACRCHREAK